MKFSRFAIAILLAVLVFSLSGCGKAEEGQAVLTLSQERVEIPTGKSHVLYCEIKGGGANAKVSWESTNEDVATVTSGEVFAKALGSCKIVAKTSSGNVVATCDVVVCDNFLRVGKNYTLANAGYGSKYFSTISEAVLASTEGSLVIVEEGVYDEFVNITKPVSLKGSGAKISGGFVVGYEKENSAIKDVHIDGFEFLVESNLPLSQSAGVYIGRNCEDISISDCKFIGEKREEKKKDWSEDGLLVGIYSLPSSSFDASSGIRVSGCNFQNLDYGAMLMPYVAESYVLSNRFDDCSFALFVCGGQKLDVESNDINSSGFLQFGYADNNANKIVVQNNSIENYPDGEIFSQKEGGLSERFVLDVSQNKFLGKNPGEMQKEELQELIKKSVGFGEDYKDFSIKFATTHQIKDILQVK